MAEEERRRPDQGTGAETAGLYSHALAGLKTSLPAFQKLQKARQMTPIGVEFKIHPLPPFRTYCWKS
jgi:hypothetical protein